MNMMRPSLPGTGMNAAAVLKINGLSLLFQQGDVRTLESASDVDGSEPMAHSVGWVNYLRQRWPVFCLSEQLELQDEVPSSRRTCALLALEDGYAGVLCDDVSIIKQLAGTRHEVPPVMRAAVSPIRELVASEHGLLCVSSANHIAAYIEHLIHGHKD